MVFLSVVVKLLDKEFLKNWLVETKPTYYSLDEWFEDSLAGLGVGLLPI